MDFNEALTVVVIREYYRCKIFILISLVINPKAILKSNSTRLPKDIRFVITAYLPACVKRFAFDKCDVCIKPWSARA